MAGMKRLIESFTLQRSGSHAVLNWLFNQFEQEVLFFNNAVPHEDLIDSMRNPAKLQNTPFLRHVYDSFEGRDKLRQEGSKWDTICVAFEDKRVIPFHNRIVNGGWMGERELTRILIIRDFYNWFASRIMMHKKSRRDLKLETAVDLWKHHANQALQGDHTVILYNDWFLHDEYRADLCNLLGIKLINDDKTHIVNSGGGSSFDGRRFQGYAHHMDVLNRWRTLDDEYLEAIAADKELLEMNITLFGAPYPWS